MNKFSTLFAEIRAEANNHFDVAKTVEAKQKDNELALADTLRLCEQLISNTKLEVNDLFSQQNMRIDRCLSFSEKFQVNFNDLKVDIKRVQDDQFSKLISALSADSQRLQDMEI